MSENITILEGGKAENFGQIARLRTDDGNGGHDLWVPAKDVETEHITIKKNGLYYTNEYVPTSAEKKDKDSHHYDIYGWEQITVSVSKKVTGKKPDGREVTVDVDDDGNLIESELPTRIEIVTEPTITDYVVGHPIDISGIVVKAYYADGGEWGEVPVSELTYDPIIALEGDPAEYEADLFEGKVKRSPTPLHRYRVGNDPKSGRWLDGGIGFFNVRGDRLYMGVCSTGEFTFEYYDTWVSDYPEKHADSTGVAGSYTHNGKTVYVQSSYVSAPDDWEINGWRNSVDASGAEIAWTLLYGKVTGGGTLITVSWDRGDGEILTDTYRIHTFRPYI